MVENRDKIGISEQSISKTLQEFAINNDEHSLNTYFNNFPFNKVELSTILKSMTSLSYELTSKIALDMLIRELELSVLKSVYENLNKVPTKDFPEDELDEEFRRLCTTLKNGGCKIDIAYKFNGETATILQTIQEKGLKNALADYERIFGKSKDEASQTIG